MNSASSMQAKTHQRAAAQERRRQNGRNYFISSFIIRSVARESEWSPSSSKVVATVLQMRRKIMV